MSYRGFISYARADELMCRALCKHLKPIEEVGLAEFWLDQKILPGEEFKEEIADRLSVTDVALLLITKEFFWSEFIRSVELPLIQKRAAAGEMVYIPIIARHVCWEAMRLTGVGARQAVPKNAKPICDFKPQDRGFADAANRIAETLRSLSLDRVR